MRRIIVHLQAVIFFSLGIMLLLSLVSFVPQDIKWISSPYNKNPHNLVGILGSYLAFFLFFAFGVVSYFFPFYFIFKGLEKLNLIRAYGVSQKKSVKVILFLILIIFFPALVGIFFSEPVIVYEKAGGLGFFISHFLRTYLGFWGSLIFLSTIVGVSIYALFSYLFLDVVSFLRGAFFKLKVVKEEILSRKTSELKRKVKTTPQIRIYTPPPYSSERKEEVIPKKEEVVRELPSLREKAIDKVQVKKKMQDLERQAKKSFEPSSFSLPHIDLLKVPPGLDARKMKEDIKENIKNLEETLADFGVSAKVVSVQKGPVVTLYELEPQPGVKITKITTLADDIALAMKSSSVRIVAPIPARGTIGVEVPNEKKHIVYLREILQESSFVSSPSKLTLAIGKDVKGEPVIADLKEMPHLLIAGTTGSGKTVCVNSLISSILFKAKPDEVKFILIDPKMVELAPFSGIPHLLSPIIYEAKKAFAALNWAVEEMESRYRLLAEEGVRNITSYNEKEFRLPYVVIVIDELADLMSVAKESIESSIQRLAQLSRAVGIHLILATQRPSVDVITGVIKANFPARISFKVSSKVDSRTVLDIVGAEKLLGKGDLLFLKPQAFRPIRAQGSYIDDEDIQQLTDFLRNQGAPVYQEKITKVEKSTAIHIEEDELFDEAVRIILTARQASASLLQRRLRVGYTRAARLLDLMEEAGIVGPFSGSKAREILVDPDLYLKEKGLV
ncbi:MAG: DNA translocase FtsK [Candidatus Omnitrophica bacterium]|nr:DNA translocase FtsK [Candidatus Omnitrophota bacterium]